jgi:ATP-dependent Zn protease
MFRAMSKGGGAGMFGGMNQNRPRETKSTVKFSDVAGSEEEKQEMYELVDYLKQPNKYAQYGARVPKGILMEGPPGTGKTLLAKAVAGEAGVSFYSMAGSEFEEMFVGLGASRVRSLFADAKKTAPCIIFIDEIDAVGRKRSGAAGTGTSEQTLNQLLVEMDGFETNAGVIVMAATNRVDAGHALIGLKLESASKVQKVTIIPRGNAGGYTIMTPKDESNFSSKEDLYASITGYLGGRAAEQIKFGKNKITTGAHDDLDKATNIAKRMVTQFGMSTLGLTKFITMQEESYGQNKGSYSDIVAAKIDEEIAKMLEKCFETSLEIIKANMPELELIAESLRVLETITAEQIDYIDKNMALPKEVLDEKGRREAEDKKRANGELVEFEPEKIDDNDDDKNAGKSDKDKD